jgi:hypothetical protein
MRNVATTPTTSQRPGWPVRATAPLALCEALPLAVAVKGVVVTGGF